MDRKTENMIYNIGRSILQETSLAKMASGINVAPDPYSDWNGYVAWRAKQGNPVSQTADPNSLETISLKQQGYVNAAAQGLNKHDTAETWGPGDKSSALKPISSTPTAPTNTVNSTDHSLFDRAGDWWGGLSTPEKTGVIGLVGAPLALGASYLAYKKMKENNKENKK